MARPKVPHCKECARLHGEKWSYWKCLALGRFITGQEVRTSPKWCPLRISGKNAKIGDKFLHDLYV